jgi:phospholipid/cholesterol/gamma-HCH transport system permease protein
MKWLAGIGLWTRELWRDLRYLIAVLLAILFFAVQPRSWAAPQTRRRFLRQLTISGVEMVMFIVVISVLVGLVVALQAERHLLGPDLLELLLVSVVAYELAPLFVNLVLLAKSGHLMTYELANLSVSGEVARMDSHGIDPLTALVMPRVLGTAFCALALTVIFIWSAFLTGFWFATVIQNLQLNLPGFFNHVFADLNAWALAGILAKAVFPALFYGIICATQGLGVVKQDTIPLATKIAMNRSLAALFIVSVGISFLFYT